MGKNKTLKPELSPPFSKKAFHYFNNPLFNIIRGPLRIQETSQTHRHLNSLYFSVYIWYLQQGKYTVMSRFETHSEKAEFHKEIYAKGRLLSEEAQGFRREWRYLVQKARAASNKRLWIQSDNGEHRDNISKVHATIKELVQDVESMRKANTLSTTVLEKHMTALKISIESLATAPPNTSSAAKIPSSTPRHDSAKEWLVEQIQAVMNESIPLLVAQLERFNASRTVMELAFRGKKTDLSTSRKKFLESTHADIIKTFNTAFNITKPNLYKFVWELSDGRSFLSEEFESVLRIAYLDFEWKFIEDWEKKMLSLEQEKAIRSFQEILRDSRTTVADQHEIKSNLREMAIEIVSDAVNNLDEELLHVVENFVKKGLEDMQQKRDNPEQ